MNYKDSTLLPTFMTIPSDKPDKPLADGSVERPTRLFRFFHPRASQIFAEQKLWFSTASDFNDIFDVFPRYGQIIDETVEDSVRKAYAFDHPEVRISYRDYRKIKEPSVRKIIEESNEVSPDGFQARFSKNFGIVCFTEHLDSLLMWGHYTDSHRGFAIEFNPQHDLFASGDFHKVIYGKNRQELTLTVKPDSAMFLHKSSEWSYEGECRLVKLKKDLSQGTNLRNSVETEGYFIPLPMDSVKAVYFGCRVLEENCNNLLQALESYPAIKTYFMRRNRIAYQLDAIPGKEWKAPSETRNKIASLPLSLPAH